MKQNKRELLFCAYMVGKPGFSRTGLKKRMWCLKMRDKTLLAKKKENFIVE